MDVFDTSSGEPEIPAPIEASPARVALAEEPFLIAGPCPADAATWRRWLERAGFSPAEAARLLFERLRPRDEGTQRI